MFVAGCLYNETITYGAERRKLYGRINPVRERSERIGIKARILLFMRP